MLPPPQLGIGVDAYGFYGPRHDLHAFPPAPGPYGRAGAYGDMLGRVEVFGDPYGRGEVYGDPYGRASLPYGMYGPAPADPYGMYGPGPAGRRGYDAPYDLGPPPPAPPANGTPMEGAVKSFVAAQGFGFLAVPGFLGDVYFKPDFEPHSGQTVHFTLRWTPDGKPQAHNPQPVLQRSKPRSKLTGGEELVGTIKSFNPKTGYGFVVCDGQTRDIYFQSKDLPAELQALKGDMVGEAVQFRTKMTKDGKPQVQDAKLADMTHAEQGMKRKATDSAVRGPPGYSRLRHPGLADAANGSAAKRPRTTVSSPAADGHATPWDPPAMAPPPPPGSGGTSLGLVKSYNPTKGFGFIESLEADSDIYFKRTDLPPDLHDASDLQGREVSFELVHSPNGKPQGKSVKVM